ncbi:MAG: hypothetical protein OEU92_05180, partial [Alphaproteobacteria bacterium]|nr:hypothetical protein [Alphaproteobacteria bacterium]
PTHRVECSGVPIVAWSKAQIESGAFGYGFSHIPFHELDLPRGTYTFLLLRDPAARVLSHYSMLRYFIDNDIAHPCLKTEGHWAADGFDRFLERVPRAHLERQVYTFDPDCDLDKALDGVARVSNVKVLANLDSLVADINDEFQLNLAPIHTRKASNPFRPDDSQRQRLEALLENEYRFLERVRRERVI